MYNIVRFCPGRLLGHPFVCIPASPCSGVGVDPKGKTRPKAQTRIAGMAVKRRPGVKEMKYAIVESGGKQYRAVEGGTLEVDRLPVDTGANVKLEQILLLVDGDNITVGTPLVKDSPVWTKVLEHFKGKKVTIFNYSPKKRIRVKTGHRQNYTRLLVEQIGGSELIKREPVEKVEKVVETKAETESPKVKAEKPVKTKTATPKEKKPAAKAPAKAASTKAAAKKPASKDKAAKPKVAEKKSTKAAPKQAAKKTTTKKPSTKKQ
jgi:large subunit ribosomal protein L21